jgi:hypothetical protein
MVEEQPEQQAEDRDLEAVASFRLGARDLDPAAITEALGIEPDLAYRRGEIYKWSGGRPIRNSRGGLWSLTTAKRTSPRDDLSTHLSVLLEMLAPCHDALLALMARDGLDADFFCGLFLRDRLGRESWLTPDLLRTIAGLGATLKLDLYP